MIVPALNILLADDSESVRRLTALQPAGLGHRVRQAPGGRALLDRFREAGSYLVISDVDMPDGDGLTAAEAIRGAVPVLLLSGEWTDEQKGRSAAGGLTVCRSLSHCPS